MIGKQRIIDKAHTLDFDDIGFASVEPFASQEKLLDERFESYQWMKKLDLWEGLDPKTIMPTAKSLIVLVDNYFRQGFPENMTGRFGRWYLDDDRVTQNGMSLRIKAFRSFLSDHDVDSRVAVSVPHKLAAARAGLGTFGKNCLFYSRQAALKGSWVILVVLAVDRTFEPDPPSITTGCPQWCHNACIAACPTGALRGPGKIEPRRCISYLSYYGEGLTPVELREPMGMWMYGCDRCQNVCPRNQAWLNQELKPNARVAAKAEFFELTAIFEMNKEYYLQNIRPHMFYMSEEDGWRWRMNAARVMGNSLDVRYIPYLSRALREDEDERVRGMAAWSLGKLGGTAAREALLKAKEDPSAVVREETEAALISPA